MTSTELFDDIQDITIGKNYEVLIKDNPTGITCRRTIVYRGRIAKPGFALYVITGPQTNRGRPQLVQEFESKFLPEYQEVDYRNELITKFIETFKPYLHGKK
jgi:hypothetical protein